MAYDAADGTAYKIKTHLKWHLKSKKCNPAH